ncbi:hypothetical protein BH11PLA2_BH11PLA2_03280 [soil metagenome]
MRSLKPIAALVFFIVAIDPARGCWWGPSYYGPPMAYYYAPPMMVYYQPMYAVPMTPTFNMAYPPPRVVPNAPPEAMPKPQAGPRSNSAAPAEVPFSEIKPATFSTPLEEKPENKVPMMELPMPKAETPKVEVPKMAPSPETPKIEFKAPKVEEAPKIDLPKVEATKVESPKLELPPLALPTSPKLELPPLNMAPIPAPMPAKSTSQFRAEPQFDIKPVTAKVDTPNGSHTIAFKNTTERDVTLIVHGQTLTLAAKHQVTATVPAAFRWKLGGEALTDVKVPASVAAYEVTIK